MGQRRIKYHLYITYSFSILHSWWFLEQSYFRTTVGMNLPFCAKLLVHNFADFYRFTSSYSGMSNNNHNSCSFSKATLTFADFSSVNQLELMSHPSPCIHEKEVKERRYISHRRWNGPASEFIEAILCRQLTLKLKVVMALKVVWHKLYMSRHQFLSCRTYNSPLCNHYSLQILLYSPC